MMQQKENFGTGIKIVEKNRKQNAWVSRFPPPALNMPLLAKSEKEKILQCFLEKEKFNSIFLQASFKF